MILINNKIQFIHQIQQHSKADTVLK